MKKEKNKLKPKGRLVREVLVSYLGMIVLPVMTVLIIAFVVASCYMYQAATDSIGVAQGAILDAYEEEMRSSAIALSHVVNMNEGSIILNLSGEDRAQRKEALNQLDTIYQLLAAPEYRILDIQIYYKDKTSVKPRWEIRFSVEDLEEKSWYQEALSHPGLVSTCLTDEDYFYRIRSKQEALAIAAIAPDDMPEVECIVLYKLSRIPTLMRNYNKEGNMGYTFLMNESGLRLNGQSEEEELELPLDVREKICNSQKSSLQISKKGMRYISVRVPDSPYYLVTVVNGKEVFGTFIWFEIACAAVVFGLALMFVFYYRRYMNQLQQAEKAKYQEELLALQSQLNPHFLLNTLNTLKFMAVSVHHDGIRDMVTNLENMLAAALNRDGDFHSVSEEISVLKSYISIMQLRYMESFEVELHIAPETEKCRVPKLILQPIVENAIMHGFDEMDDCQGKIRIESEIIDKILIFRVIDNGKGIKKEKIRQIFDNTLQCAPDGSEKPQEQKRRTIGVSNTDRRLKLNFGDQYGVQIVSEPGRFTEVTMRMPVVMVKMQSDFISE